ncbi:MAG: M20 family metallopeptidase [Gemmatimonadota bacterium]
MTTPPADFRPALEDSATTDRVLDRLERLVAHETPSGDAARIDALAAVLADELAAFGATVTRIPAPGLGTHVSARFPGAHDHLAPVLVLAHMDTVHPVGSLAERPFRVADGRAWGPGTYDMKAGLAVVAESLAFLHRAGERPRRPVHLLATCDEEIGSHSSRSLIEDGAREACCVLVPEPCRPDGGAKTARKGVGVYTLHATGVAVHAGIDSGGGVNAIVELAHQILGLARLADPERGTTLNAGVIRGGTASNVVPASADVEIDVRFRTVEEGERADAELRALEPVLPGARLRLEGGINRPPLERTPAVVELYETARALAAALGFDLPEGETGGASDGCFTAALGVPTLDGLGVLGDGAHAFHEHIVIGDVPRRVALFGRLFQTL